MGGVDGDMQYAVTHDDIVIDVAIMTITRKNLTDSVVPMGGDALSWRQKTQQPNSMTML
jgi:hypothetical protein